MTGSIVLKNRTVWLQDGQRNLGNLTLTSSIVQQATPLADCLSRKLTDDDDEQTAFVNAIAIDAEQSLRLCQLRLAVRKTAESKTTRFALK